MAYTYSALFTGATRSRRCVATLTESAPSAASEGINLEGVGNVTLVFRAPVGQTFAGGGTITAYLLSQAGDWVPMPSADIDMTKLNGLEVVALQERAIGHRKGRLAFRPASVTLSGAGTTFTLDYECTAVQGAQPENV